MSYTIIADIHTKLTGYDMLVDGIPEGIYYPLLNLRNAAKYAKEHNSTLVILGDIIHEKNKIHQVVKQETTDCLQEIGEDLKVETVIIAGNHDYIRYNEKLYTWLSDIRFNNINIVLPDQSETMGNVCFLANSTTEKMIEVIESTSSEILFSHFGLYEASLSGSEFKTGELSVKNLSKFKKVVLGHIHKPQELSKGKIVYVGSSTPLTIAEYSEEKRFMFYDDSEDKEEFIPTIYPKTEEINLTEDNINIEDLEQKIMNGNKFKIVADSNVDISKLKQLEKKFPGYLKVKKVVEKVEVTVSSISAIDLDTIISKVMQLGNIPRSKQSVVILLAKELLHGEKQ